MQYREISAVLAAFLTFLVGCDSVRTSEQRIRMSVTHAGDGSPASGVKIALSPHYTDGWRSDLDLDSRNRLWISEYNPNSVGETTPDGMLEVPVRLHTIRGGLCPPAYDPAKDRVTGHEYLVRASGNNSDEFIRMRMEPNLSQAGQHFRLKLLSVSSAKEIRDQSQ